MNNKNSNFIQCKVCNKKLKSLTTSHLKTHHLTLKSYCNLFGLENSENQRCQYSSENYFNDPTYNQHKCVLNVDSKFDTDYCYLHSHNTKKDAFIFNEILDFSLDCFQS